MPLPRDHVGLVVCSAARARQWQVGLRRAGFTPVVVETSGSDMDKGDCQVGVPAAEARAAQGLVSAVLKGHKALPRAPLASWASLKLVLVALLVAVISVSLALAAVR